MKTAKLFLFIFLLFIYSSFVYSFDCNYFQDQKECNSLNDIDESLIADLIYTNNSFPDHDFIKDYNDKIRMSSAPFDTESKSKDNLFNVWFTFLSASPSIIYNNDLFVPDFFELRSEHHYDYIIPSNYYNNKKRVGRTCKIIYSLYEHSGKLKIYVNDVYITDNKIAYFSISKQSIFKGLFTASVTIKEDYYEWHRSEYRWYCSYDHTSYKTDTLTVSDVFDVEPYSYPISSEFTIKHRVEGNIIGEKKNKENNLEIIFNNSYYKESFFEYGAVFSKEPYYFLTLKANNISSRKIRNLYVDNNILTVKSNNTCIINYDNFFDSKTKPCENNVSELSLEPFKKKSFTKSWNLLFVILIFLFLCWLIYLGIKNSWGKKIIPIILSFLVVPFASAECGLTNLASCIPMKMYEFFINLLNAPLQPLLSLMRSLMENPPSIELFHGVWIIIVYCMSLFYGFLIMYSGLQFLLSGHNVIKREVAKEWLKNTVIMIVLIQASFYLYGLILELGAVMTSSVLSIVSEQFFLLTADNLSNIGLEFIFISFYVLTLFITILLLFIRYLIVSFGVIIAPLGIFCYFIPPLKSYGKLTLNILGMFIFITFIDAIIILGCSMLISIPLFENIKILVMISCLTMINTLFIILTIKTIFKAVFSSNNGGGEIAQAVKYIGMMG